MSFHRFDEDGCLGMGRRGADVKPAFMAQDGEQKGGHLHSSTVIPYSSRFLKGQKKKKTGSKKNAWRATKFKICQRRYSPIELKATSSRRGPTGTRFEGPNADIREQKRGGDTTVH